MDNAAVDNLNKEYKPLVSIVIPVYNGSNYLAEAIDSALNQTYDNVEIVVVNDGSCDDGKTRQVALAYGDRIRYFEKENGGSSSALNYGISQMSGEWFSWLSHDDLYFPNKIEAEIEYLNQKCAEENEIANTVVFCGAENVNASGKVLKKTSVKKLREKAALIENMTDNAQLIASQLAEYNFHGCGGLVHRTVFESVGVFDEELRLLNDVDMWFRIYSAGYRIRLLPEILVKGRVHAKQLSTAIGYSYHNAEQDMFWQRTLLWLKENRANDWEFFFQYGKAAYTKTRKAEGKEAFSIASSLKPNKKPLLWAISIRLRFFSAIRTILKKLYLAVMKRRK